MSEQNSMHLHGCQVAPPARRLRANVTTVDFAPLMGPVARILCGKLLKETRSELRFGSNGSLKVDLTRGTFFDFETNMGGGVLDLIAHKTGEKDGAALAWLRGKGFVLPELIKEAPKTWREPVAEYDYMDANGVLVLQVVRYADQKRRFSQRRRGQDGSWIWSTKGITQVPYRLSEVLEAIAQERVIVIVEGEKDADNLAKIGITASCNAGGANKWRPELTPHFTGADVVLVPDNDDPGRAHMVNVGAKLSHIARRVRILELPDLPPKGDVSDWLDAGGTHEALDALIANASDWALWAPLQHDAEKSTPASPPLIAASANEDAIADAFAERHRSELRFCHDWGSWLRWDGSRWERERKRLAFHFARQAARDANAENKATPAKASTAAGVERFAQADPRLSTVHEDWDCDVWLLAAPTEVTVELRTGAVREARREDYITKRTAVAPAPQGTPTPLWTTFLREATGGDQELIAYLQRVAGYCLSGSVSEHALFFLYGDGGNGKGVFINTLTRILGDAAVVASMDTFTASKGDRHETEIAMLRGARLVAAQETEEGRAWSEVRIKALTGGDSVTARFMRQDHFTFEPTFKLMIAGNHKPNLKSADAAMRRRFNIIPFTRKPPVPDPDLAEKLKAEWAGILRWAVDGCLAWQALGLNPPAVVRGATDTYFAEQDVFMQWCDDCCEMGNTKSDTKANLFTSWRTWAERNGETPGSSKSFVSAMLKAGCQEVRHTPGHRGKRGFTGIALKAVDTSAQWQNESAER